MTYTADDLLKRSLNIIDLDEDILFIDDLVCLLPCSRSTFYAKIPSASAHMDAIRSKIEINRLNTKKRMRKNWSDKDAAWYLQVKLYRLIANDEEKEVFASEKSNDPYASHPTEIVINAQQGNELITN